MVSPGDEAGQENSSDHHERSLQKAALFGSAQLSAD